jgi:hypothetical protein
MRAVFDESKAEIEANARRYAQTVLDPMRCRDLYRQVAMATGDEQLVRK